MLKTECEEAVAEAKREWEAKCEEAEEKAEELQQELYRVKGQLVFERGSVSALRKVIDETLAKHMAVDK